MDSHIASEGMIFTLLSAFLSIACCDPHVVVKVIDNHRSSSLTHDHPRVREPSKYRPRVVFCTQAETPETTVGEHVHMKVRFRGRDYFRRENR